MVPGRPAAVYPAWVAHLESEDLGFIRNLVLASGSLKEMASRYEVSYPTLRRRLDQVIERVRQCEDNEVDAFRSRLRELVAAGDLTTDHAKELLALHQQEE